MNFENWSRELQAEFEILAQKGQRYDPRNWERLWPGSPARWVFKFLGQAMTASADSLCLNRHTGACLVDLKKQQNGDLAPFAVSNCFNGAPTGIRNCVEKGECHYKEKAMEAFRAKHEGMRWLPDEMKEEFAEFKKAYFQFCVACHAETNALDFAYSPVKGRILFCTTDPCPECAKSLTQRGIGAIVYSVPYKTETDGAPKLAEQSREYFDQAKIPCVNINVPDEYFEWLFASIRGAGQPIRDETYDL